MMKRLGPFPLTLWLLFVPLLAPAWALAASCGDGIIQTSERCDDHNRVGGDGCNTNCNVEPGYGCVGTHPSVCAPVDVVVCGNGLVQPGEECDGGPCCRDDCQLERKGSVCRTPRGECDKAETCNGGSPECPADGRQKSVCRPSLGPCNPPERCTGESDFCPMETRKSNGSVCRPAAGGCDVAEACNGVGATCPANSVRDAGAICRAAVSPECDVTEVCTGSLTACPADVLIGCPDVDGIDCVHPACGESGECTTTDDCVELCRQPTFWGNHSGEEKGRLNLTQAVLDQTGPLEICGQTIDSTDLGDLDSAIEALCIRRQGVEKRTLFRALVTTALNCAVSEGGTCDDIVSRFVDASFTECNERCAGTADPGDATTRRCISELFCFNRGGRSFDGQCALGTCDDTTRKLCGDDFAACDELGGQCQPFDGNCSDAKLCTTGLETEADICFAGRALPSSPRLCASARRNECTIDSCP